METQATARPWHVGGYVPGNTNPEDEMRPIGYAFVSIPDHVGAIQVYSLHREVSEANAILIVRSVNQHDALVEALDTFLPDGVGNDDLAHRYGLGIGVIKLARAAQDAARLSGTSESEGQ